MFDLKYQLKLLPDKPGVYLMKNNLGEIIYVGKAKILKNRVRQYFQSSKNHTEKVKAMVSNVAEFEYIVTDTEMEALILECNLIKKYRPRYNILLKDDKGYPYIKITTGEDFPRVYITRLFAKDGSKYFGPYTDVTAANITMELIKKIFPLRNCKKYISEKDVKDRPCLNYHIGLCKAPCAGLISKSQYREMIDGIIDILNGKDKNIIKELKSQMEEAAENLEFEKAASFRDKINAVQKIIEKQKITSQVMQDEDFINLESDDKDTCIQVFFVREGKVLGREHFILQDTENTSPGEIVSDFIKEFYGGTAFIPPFIYVPEADDMDLLRQWLTMRREGSVDIRVPVRGEKKNFLNLVQSNAKATLEQFKLKLIKDKELHKKLLEELQELLEMDELPHRIEAYDISNIQGMDSVGSMIVFEDAKPKNSDYRRFRIKTVKGANDYDSMREILERRFTHGLEEVRKITESHLELSAGKFCIFPDLIMMDGGKGQVNIAMEVLNKYNINIPVCGMVKDDYHNTRGLIYNNKEIVIDHNSEIMHFITRIQDEVHRFAISYHRSLRNKRVLHSILEEIPNIGERRRQELLKKFGSVENIKEADYEELLETPSIDKKAAMSIISYFKT